MTIYNLKLYIGRDDVLYDAETELYYMHARYYDPEAGRFIMKDPVEGSLGNPITQNSYIYCANDPVNKIDPAGTTPQNTGLPPRYENEPQAVKWAGSNRTAFCLPPTPVNDSGNIGLDRPEVGTPEAVIYTPQPENLGNDVWLKGDAMDTFDSCGGGKTGRPYNHKLVAGEGYVDIGEYRVVYGVDEEGRPVVDVNPKPGGKGTDEEAQAIENRMNDAIWDLYNADYFDTHSLGSLIQGVGDFYNKYNAEWNNLITRGKVSGTLADFMYHATRGLAIGTEMGKWGRWNINNMNVDMDEHDAVFGFWASYNDEKYGLGLSFRTTSSTTPGLVDFANLMKSIAWEESEMGTRPGTWDVYGGKYYNATGPMQFSQMYINEYLEWTGGKIENSWFKALGLGIEIFMRKLRKSSNNFTDLRWENWEKAVDLYRGEGIDPDYVSRVWDTLQRMRQGKIPKELEEKEKEEKANKLP